MLKKNTLINIMKDEAYKDPTSSTIRWETINPLWLRGSTQLISNKKIKKVYLEALINQSLAEGISYIESRRSFGLDIWLYEVGLIFYIKIKTIFKKIIFQKTYVLC